MITRPSDSFARSGSSNDARTGASVIDKTKAPASAKTTVSAMGRNIYPSIPSSVRIGR